MDVREVVIVGGGPAGLAAAVALKKLGIRDILVIEREKQSGGILRQCIHDGFGLTRFGETLSGPEYAQRFMDEAQEYQVEVAVNATVIDITPEKVVTADTREGLLKVKAKAIILTMGCRERTRGALSIPGTRPAGVYNAGVAQSYMNLYNTMVGKKVIIMGSGDIGLIMARRLTLEGAHVEGVFEILPYPSGLPRNIEQCLRDYHIPLYLSHSVIEIKGEKRIQAVTVAQVDERMQVIEGSEKEFPCDTLILSVGLIPENELSLGAGVCLDDRTKGAVVDENFQTSVPGIFAAGNVLHVHDLVDFVSLEAEAMAEGVSQYLRHGCLEEARIQVKTDAHIGHVIPQKLSGRKDVRLSLRVRQPMKPCRFQIRQGGHVIKEIKMPKAVPAEMIQFTIKAEDFRSMEEIEVMVNE